MFYRALLVVSFVYSYVSSSYLYADDSYQFAVSLAGEELAAHYGEGEVYSISGAAYLEPIQITNEKPHALEPIYQRVSSISLQSVKGRASGLRTISGGQILDGFDIRSDRVGVELARKDIPFWVGLGLIKFHENEYRFVGGGRSESFREYERQFSLGLYVDDWMKGYAYYQEGDQETYGVGLRSICNVWESHFIELKMDLQFANDYVVKPEIINATVRNLSVMSNDYQRLFTHIGYYPNQLTSFALGFYHYDWERDISQDIFEVSFSRYLTSDIVADVAYSEMHNNSLADTSAIIELNSFSFGLSYLF